jgi:hypothetical protein
MFLESKKAIKSPVSITHIKQIGHMGKIIDRWRIRLRLHRWNSGRIDDANFTAIHAPCRILLVHFVRVSLVGPGERTSMVIKYPLSLADGRHS